MAKPGAEGYLGDSKISPATNAELPEPDFLRIPRARFDQLVDAYDEKAMRLFAIASLLEVGGGVRRKNILDATLSNQAEGADWGYSTVESDFRRATHAHPDIFNSVEGRWSVYTDEELELYLTDIRSHTGSILSSKQIGTIGGLTLQQADTANSKVSLRSAPSVKPATAAKSAKRPKPESTRNAVKKAVIPITMASAPERPQKSVTPTKPRVEQLTPLPDGALDLVPIIEGAGGVVGQTRLTEIITKKLPDMTIARQQKYLDLLSDRSMIVRRDGHYMTAEFSLSYGDRPYPPPRDERLGPLALLVVRRSGFSFTPSEAKEKGYRATEQISDRTRNVECFATDMARLKGQLQDLLGYDPITYVSNKADSRYEVEPLNSSQQQSIREHFGL